MKFASFETIVENLYKYVIPTPKDQCSNSLHRTSWTYTQLYICKIFVLLLSLYLLYLFVAGCEADRAGGSFHPWPSSSYSHDWDPYWSSMGNL